MPRAITTSEADVRIPGIAHGTMTSLASTHGRTPAQILFRYLSQSGAVPLTGTRSEIHMREDLAIFDFKLAPAEWAAIDKILDG